MNMYLEKHVKLQVVLVKHEAVFESLTKAEILISQIHN